MNEVQSEFINIHQLHVGMYIELEVGWMSHPFPTGSFKVSSMKQIEIIRGLGLARVRYFPGKSDQGPGSSLAGTSKSLSASDRNLGEQVTQTPTEAEEVQLRKQRTDLLSAQQRDLMACDRRCGEAIRQYKLVVEQINSKPRSAAGRSLELVKSFVGEILGQGETIIRLISEGMGDRAAMHPVNVTVVSLLLGKSLRLPQSDMIDLGMAAFLHDIGKTQLPDRVRWPDENFSPAEYKLYQEHVAQGVVASQRMELTYGVRQAIAQHHEMVDGSGFPARLEGDSLSLPAKIVALVNRYDNLCNPSRPATAITPHEALSLIFAQLKTKFDSVALSAFIRMMGVYPPGSVVQLVDGKYAIVVSVNSSRPLKPRVIVYEPTVPKHEALILDLEQTPSIGIRRSLKPVNLPMAAMEYLSPRQRICYFFEKAVDSSPAEDSL